MRKRYAHAVEGSYRLVAEVVSGFKNLGKITVGGAESFTSKERNIHIRALPPDNVDGWKIGRCMIDHEASHQAHTDFDVWTGPRRQKGMSPVRLHLQNIFEDVWIEKERPKSLPGTKRNFREGVEVLVKRGELGTVGQDPASAFLNWMLNQARSVVLGQDALAPAAAAGKPVVLSMLGSKLTAALCKIISEDLVCVTSTSESFNLVDRVEELLKDAAKQMDQQPQPQSGQSGHDEQSSDGSSDKQSDPSAGSNDGDSQGSDSGDQDGPDGSDASGSDSGASNQSDPSAGGNDGDPQGSGSGDQDGSDGSDASGSDSGADNQSNPSAGGNDGDSQGSDSGDRVGSDESDTNSADSGPDGQGDSVNEAAQGGSARVGGLGPHVQKVQEILEGGDARSFDLGDLLEDALDDEAAAAVVSNTAPVLSPECVPSPGGATVVDSEQVARATTGLRTRLYGLLDSCRRDYGPASTRGRRVDPKRLHRVALGYADVFRKKVETSSVNTAVVVLLDVSGSMRAKSKGWPIQTAAPATYGIMKTLRSLPGIASAAAAFPGGTVIRKDEGGEKSVYLLSGWNEPLRAQNYTLTPSGGTPLASALWWALWQLLDRPEPRKLVLVITDGQPAANHIPWAQDLMCKQMPALGIEAYGLGIHVESIKSLFPDRPHAFRVVTDTKEVPAALYGMLRDALLDTQKERAA